MYRVYVDKLGRRWIRLDKDTVWNSEAGFGGWFKGNDLVLVDSDTNTSSSNPPKPAQARNKQ